MRSMTVSMLLTVLFMAQTSTVALAIPVTGVQKQDDGVRFTMQPGVMQVQVWADNVIRVTYAQGNELPALKSWTVVGNPAAAKWAMRETPEAIIIETASLAVQINRSSGSIGFLDLSGRPILQETNDGKRIAPTTQEGVNGTMVQQSFILPADEGIYGLGQHQQGYFNYRGHAVRLLQENREVGVPVALSSKGYMLLWDNPAVTEISVGAPVSQGGRAPAGAGENIVRWSSEVGKAIDYYFIYGPSADAAMRSYRTLSGDAPMMPRWLLGFWQCKERYRTQEEMLSIAKQYRDLKLPIDGIIQDWRYWPEGNNTWGSHAFDPQRYPNPAQMFKDLRAMNYHTLISVWPKFDLGSENIRQLEDAGAMFDPVIRYVYPPGQGKWYDPFSEKGRQIYWKQISSQLFALGVDGWWLDAPEPELSGKWGEFRIFRTSAGPGAEVFNAYPLMHSTGIYQGQRAQTSDKRVVILTRSAYAGQQRNSAITWSGDIGSTWTVLRNQVPAGLNFSVSGIPYWNTDIGGFSNASATGNMNPQDPRYQEIFARWFQFGAFCPMFRVHGSAPQGGVGPGKEVWRFDQKTQGILANFLKLRYRLLPYIYSTSWQVTHNGAAMMRPLVMDFPDNPQVLGIGDQYLFGPLLMVNPVTTQGATTRSVYLPGKGPWYDFWTGETQPGGKQIDAAAPIEQMPLYVRAGSILPMGPLIQYTSEKPADPIELRVCRGADGTFTLYEDEGDGYAYEKGAFATIPLTWNETAQTLTIGQRQGEFPGMLRERTFRVVWVSANHGAGIEPTQEPDAVVRYTGATVDVKYQPR